jgi:hypothetical protein
MSFGRLLFGRYLAGLFVPFLTGCIYAGSSHEKQRRGRPSGAIQARSAMRVMARPPVGRTGPVLRLTTLTLGSRRLGSSLGRGSAFRIPLSRGPAHRLNAGDVSAADPGARSVEFKLKDRSRQTDTAIMEIDSIVRASREDARAVLEASAAGKWALIHGSDEVETFDSFDDAAAQAVKEFGVGSYLIRTAGASTVTLPASVVFQRA